MYTLLLVLYAAVLITTADILNSAYGLTVGTSFACGALFTSLWSLCLSWLTRDKMATVEITLDAETVKQMNRLAADYEQNKKDKAAKAGE